MYGPWKSDRLIYRAANESDDEALFVPLISDPEAVMNASTRLPLPPGKKKATAQREWFETQLVGAVICLPSENWSGGADFKDIAEATPIGALNLFPIEPLHAKNRSTGIGVRILQPHQGKGYGSESIKWALNFAFRYAGLHRVEIGAMAYNTGAVRLYEKLGFVPEGRKREWIFHNGKFWDFIEFAMLDHEFWKIYGLEVS